MVERNIGNSQRRACADDGENSRIMFGIGREHHRNDLRLGEIAFRKQGTQRTIDHPARQRLLLRHSAFAFDVPARDFARGVGVLAIIARQGKKALVRFRVSGGARRHQDDGFTPADHHGSARLFGNLAGLDRQFPTVEVNLKRLYVHLWVQCRTVNHERSSERALPKGKFVSLFAPMVHRTSLSAEKSAECLVPTSGELTGRESRWRICAQTCFSRAAFRKRATIREGECKNHCFE